ncbi:hypothetical protein [Marilutibacter maris]|uniref:hypothetical protein n=1 Tax=Marilutibacter maris TaxID=1605891 RepID=UPI000DA945A8|nr:hypothetical protein [Lysobacter maris]
MSNVVKFLEALAVNLDVQAPDQLRALAEQSFGEGELSDALARGDADAIGQLMETAKVTYCMLLPAEDDEPRRDDEQEDAPDREEPSREESSLAA